MKKIWISVAVLLLIIVAALHQALITTYYFYDFQNTHPDVMQGAEIAWETISFTSIGQSGTAYQSLGMGPLIVPVTFAAEYEQNTTTVHAATGSRSVTLFAPEQPDFFVTYADEFNIDDQAAICDFLSRTSKTEACANALSFHRALLRLTHTDVNLFTRSADKNLFLKLMIIKDKQNERLSTRVSEFETEHGTGFLYHLGNSNYAAHFFTDGNTLYPINFTDMSEGDVAEVLSRITVESPVTTDGTLDETSDENTRV